MHSWLPTTVDGSEIEEISELAAAVRSLRYPLQKSVMVDFMKRYMQVENLPERAPMFISNAILHDDRARREATYLDEVTRLDRLIEAGAIRVTAARQVGRVRLENATFSRAEALDYLNRRRLLGQALASGESFKDQIQEPELPDALESERFYCFGFPDDLIRYGILTYRLLVRQTTAKSIDSEVDHTSSNASRNLKASVGAAGVNEAEGLEDNQSRFNVQSESPDRSEIQSSSEERAGATMPVKASAQGDSSSAVRAAPNLDHSAEGELELLAMKELTEILDVSRQTIYNYMNTGSPSHIASFPLPREVGGVNKWIRSEVTEWMKSRPKARQGRK
ncbi:MAG: AlpA family phage regulatory protein [Burkholderiales bacterium]|nr:AlpA family phage regulatory protein [Burkholderiales bacterium]